MAKTKVSPVKFIGGSRDGMVYDVPDHANELNIAPGQWTEPFVFPVDAKGDEQCSPAYVVENYTRRGISVEGADIEFFALSEMDDAGVLEQLLQRYQGEPVVYGEPPDYAVRIEPEGD